jgi:hypothetical protein
LISVVLVGVGSVFGFRQAERFAKIVGGVVFVFLVVAMIPSMLYLAR